MLLSLKTYYPSRAIFKRVSKVIRNCFGVTLLRSMIGLKKLAPPSQPIRNKTKTNRDLVARVFSRLAPVTCICFKFSLVRSVVYACCKFQIFRVYIIIWYHNTSQPGYQVAYDQAPRWGWGKKKMANKASRGRLLSSPRSARRFSPLVPHLEACSQARDEAE